MAKRLLALFILAVALMPALALADSQFFPADVEELRAINIKIALYAVLIFVFLIVYALVENTDGAETKAILYILMAAVTVIPTIYFAASAIYLNKIAVTAGPIHWHADFRILACGEELLAPIPPTTLSNKTGSAVLHEHEDRRIHVEGVVIDLADVSLAKFFGVQGGELTTSKFSVPTATGIQTFQNGDVCDGPPSESGRAGATSGEWNVFVYQTDGGVATQTKLVDYPNYVLRPHAQVPPGDCLIFEFGDEKSRTDQLCNFYQLEVNKGNLTIN